MESFISYHSIRLRYAGRASLYRLFPFFCRWTLSLIFQWFVELACWFFWPRLSRYVMVPLGEYTVAWHLSEAPGQYDLTQISLFENTSFCIFHSCSHSKSPLSSFCVIARQGTYIASLKVVSVSRKKCYEGQRYCLLTLRQISSQIGNHRTSATLQHSKTSAPGAI